MLHCSQETQTDSTENAPQHPHRSAALNIPKLSISVEDAGPKGGVLHCDVCVPAVALTVFSVLLMALAILLLRVAGVWRG